MNCTVKNLLSAIFVAAFVGNLHAEPRYAEGSLTKLESMMIAGATTAFVPDFEPDKKYESERWASKRGYFDIKPSVKIAWIEIHVYRVTANNQSTSWSGELKSEFDKADWKDDQPELDEIVGFAAPEAVYVFPDSDSKYGYWMVRVWKGAAEILAAFKCGDDIYQGRPDSKCAVIRNQGLIESMLKSASDESKDKQ